MEDESDEDFLEDSDFSDIEDDDEEENEFFELTPTQNKSSEPKKKEIDTETFEPLKCGKRCKKCVYCICARSGFACS
eukprot:gene3806-6967_t